jgi:nicotinamidase/pyrazinamidase
MRTVFFDIDTQIDFMLPAGALYVPGAERLLPAIAALNRYAAACGIPLVSDVDAHAENDPEFRIWPPHCIAGTLGQAKPAETLLDRRVVIPNQPAAVEVAGAPQIIFEKQALDPFTNPNIRALLDALGAGEYVVYGVVTEYCVRCATLGLIATGKPVTVVTDAVQTLNGADSQRTLREFTKAGVRLATAGQMLSCG